MTALWAIEKGAYSFSFSRGIDNETSMRGKRGLGYIASLAVVCVHRISHHKYNMCLGSTEAINEHMNHCRE